MVKAVIMSALLKHFFRFNNLTLKEINNLSKTEAIEVLQGLCLESPDEAYQKFLHSHFRLIRTI